MQNNIKPGDDFFGYVNKEWIDANPIPPEESRWGSFNVLHVEVQRQLKELLEEISKKSQETLDSNARKVRDFYLTGMDADTLAMLGDAPLGEFLDVVAAARSLSDLSRAIGTLHRGGVNVFWSAGVDQDVKKSDTMALYLSQGGLGLPDRDYYLKDDAQSKAIRAGYAAYEEGMIAAAPLVNNVVPAGSVDIETKLAAASMTRVELRDIEKQYNKMTPDELSKLAPKIDWDAYWAGANIAAKPEYIIVCQPKFMEEVERIFETIPLDGIKDYLRWHVLNSLAGFLGEDFEKRIFDFYGRTFAGATEMKPRWRRVLGVVNGMLDEAVGRLYVERHFGEGAKAKIGDLVAHLTVAYAARIAKLDWMGPETKQKALAKLGTVTKKLGYPDKWKDYGALEIGTDSYAANYLRAHRFEFDRQARKIGKPVDRSEWYMSPQTVNACYQPPMNEILFPAAILQPPFFDPNADLGTNFGGIGTVIGHELTHGFDDQGALFDLHGNLSNWWTPEDKARFDAQTTKLAAQYDRYEILPGLHVNGKLTLGENIADLGGLVIAYDGLKLALEDAARAGNGNTAAPAGGLTPYQRFFTNYAVTERGSIRDEALRLQVQTDPHSPSPCRVNGPLSDMTEFYDAFDVKKGDALWREEGDRVNIW
ncbi:MAG: M13 family metallopeptidase [Candidatus Pacebacteria bacterium]|nr:M13 family metallopeptidase [Candidatus Paceibacterota bacterium]